MPKQLVLPADTRSAAAATIPALETQNKKFRAPEPRTSELAAAKRNYQVVLKVKSNIYFAETAIALLCCIAFAPVCASRKCEVAQMPMEYGFLRQFSRRTASS